MFTNIYVINIYLIRYKYISRYKLIITIFLFDKMNIVTLLIVISLIIISGLIFLQYNQYKEQSKLSFETIQTTIPNAISNQYFLPETVYVDPNYMYYNTDKKEY